MKNVIKHLLLGVLLGLILAPSTTQAQWTVFDPAQYSLQIERQIEEANRWLERVKHYSDEINKLAEQLSTMNRIAMFDATLARLYHDLQTAEARQAGAALEMKQAKDKLDAELAKPQTEQCAHCISDLKLEIASCEKMIADLDTQITNLSTQIEDRVKLYNLTMEERVRIANRVKATDEAWDKLNIVKDDIFAAIERGGMPAPPRRPNP